MVGDPGIEPGVGRPGGVTVRCRTLQPVARSAIGKSRCVNWRVDTHPETSRQPENGSLPTIMRLLLSLLHAIDRLWLC